MQSHRRAPLFILGGGVLAGLALIAALALSQPRPYIFAGVVQPDPAPVEDFALEAAGGRAIALSDLRGRYGLIVFGYTFCPDVCPGTLALLGRVLAGLGSDRDQVFVAFISIDPERDTPDRTATYAALFDPAFIGLSGTPAAIATAASRFNVTYARQEAPGSAAGYLMSHSAYVYLVDPQGHWRVSFPYGVTDDEITRDLQHLIAEVR